MDDDSLSTENGISAATGSDPSSNGTPQQKPKIPDDGEKLRMIREACRKEDLAALADLATSRGGLLSDEARQEACTSEHPIV